MPAITVIIPTYNAEKYITQCLDSVLNQTFTDFDVIVIDDCSTDQTVATVEKIAPEFDGRLRLIRRETNSGGAARPRNIGINLARGDYVFFLDGDDVIVKDALEVLIGSARSFAADIVHVEKYFVTADENITAQSKLRIDTHQMAPFVEKPTLETGDISERVKRFCRKEYMWWGCSKLFRREFLIENELHFIAIPSTEDMIFTFEALCCGGRCVRIPNIIYVYRQTQNSVTRGGLDFEKKLRRYVKIVVDGVRELERFMNGIKFFTERPEFRYAALNFFVQVNVGFEAPIYSKAPTPALDTLLRRQLSAERGDLTALTAQLFSLTNIYRLQINQLQMQLRRQNL